MIVKIKFQDVFRTFFISKLFQNKLNYKLLLYIYIILLIILGPRRSKMETPNYTLYEPTFDPNELKREMAKLAINRDSVNTDDETKEKTEEDVSREMNPYWRVQSLVDNLAGKASAESALVHHEVPYMLRSLINLENNWAKVDTILRKNGEQGLISIHIPPQRPLYVICGTSHVKNLARISHTDYDDVKVHSDRTAYVVMNTGSAAGFKFWGQLIRKRRKSEKVGNRIK